MLRYLDSRPISEFYRKILINEIVTDPKIDYSGGGWTGIPGPGKPGSSDDWLELINRTEDMISTTNFYLIVKNKNSEKIKKLTFKYNGM